MELANTSAWTNRHKSPQAKGDFGQRLEDGLIVTCDMVRLELLWSARDATDFADLREELGALITTPISAGTWQRAIDVFQQLVARGPLHHRQVTIPDTLIAAAAEEAGLPVLHYDRDFELIAEVTGQPVRAIAPPGSLD
jgi:predicted nucleic acid-binding protein